jgi:Zn-dependent membrane protease YugP
MDPLYWILVGPTILLALWAQLKVKSAFSQYSRVGSSSGRTGAQAACQVLDAAGVTGVTIEESHGFLSDHYDPRSRTLRLSPDVYSGRSLSAVGVAAHEAGHAMQHARAYAPLAIRSVVAPAAQFGSWIAWPAIFGGMIMQWMGLVQLGVLLFSFLVIFQIITLPVEFDASRRAKKALADGRIIMGQQEAAAVSSVLSAAAMTYVAATISSLATLLYYLIRLGIIGGSRDD